MRTEDNWTQVNWTVLYFRLTPGIKISVFQVKFAYWRPLVPLRSRGKRPSV